MSSELPPSNPYSSPSPGSFGPGPTPAPQFKEDQPGQAWQIDYFGFMGMIQSYPGWVGNLFLAGVCALIPIVGPMVVQGYGYEAAVVLHRTGGSRYLPFDFNKFGEYLIRGLGPFLVSLAVGMFIQFFNFGTQICAGGLAAGAGDNEAVGAVAGIFVLLVALMLIPISFVLAIMQMPLMLRGGMSADVGQSFNFNWAFDFLKRCWLETLLALLVMALVAIPLVLLGFFTCCIGLIPAIAYIQLMNGWFGFQLYRVYLSRGGEPMPVKMPTAPAM